MTIPKARAPKRSRYAWPVWRSRPLPRLAVISDEPPTAQITFYREACMLTRRDGAGVWRSYPIDPAALAQSLGALPRSSGLLPQGTIATGSVSGAPFFVMLVPACITPVQLDEGGRPRVYQVPLPTLVWAGCRSDYRVFALADERVNVSTPLLLAPLPNTYGHGAICWGDTRDRAEATGTTMRSMLKLFLEEAAFNDHLANGKSKRHPTSVLPALRTLAKAATPEYPLDDLVATAYTLDYLINGRAWGKTDE